MGFTTYWKNQTLDSILSSTVYAGFSTANPGDDGSGLAEPSGGNYSRVAIASTDWVAAVAGEKKNGILIQFNTATGSWGTLSYLCLFDAISGGNLLLYLPLTVAKSIAANQYPSIAISGLNVTLV